MVLAVTLGAKQSVRRDAKGTRLKVVDAKIIALVAIKVDNV